MTCRLKIISIVLQNPMRLCFLPLVQLTAGSWLSPGELEARAELSAELAELREQNSNLKIGKNQDERIGVWMFLRENSEHGNFIREFSALEKLPRGLALKNGGPVPTSSEAAKVFLCFLARKSVSREKSSRKDSYRSARVFIEARMLGEHRGMSLPGGLEIVDGLLVASPGSHADRALEDFYRDRDAVAAALTTKPFTYMHTLCDLVEWDMFSGKMLPLNPAAAAAFRDAGFREEFENFILDQRLRKAFQCPWSKSPGVEIEKARSPNNVTFSNNGMPDTVWLFQRPEVTSEGLSTWSAYTWENRIADVELKDERAIEREMRTALWSFKSGERIWRGCFRNYYGRKKRPLWLKLSKLLTSKKTNS